MELDYALTANKRIIPIIREEPDESIALGALAAAKLDQLTSERLGSRDLMTMARQNWQALARHNWLFFRKDEDFEAAFEKLVDAIDNRFRVCPQPQSLALSGRTSGYNVTAMTAC